MEELPQPEFTPQEAKELLSERPPLKPVDQGDRGGVCYVCDSRIVTYAKAGVPLCMRCWDDGL